MKRSVAEALSSGSDHDGVPRTIAESIYQRIRQDILWMRLAPGSALRSDELRARYNVGISPLREALTRLEFGATCYIGRAAGFQSRTADGL